MNILLTKLYLSNIERFLIITGPKHMIEIMANLFSNYKLLNFTGQNLSS